MKQRRKPGLGAGMFGPRDRMRRDEMHTLREKRRYGGDNATLDAPDIGEDRARAQMRGDIACRISHRADGHAEDHEIGAGRRLFGVIGDGAELDCSRTLANVFAAIEARNFLPEILPTRDMREGRADQAQTDQRNFVKEWRRTCRTKPFRHAASPDD
jgi:hypothetical protein